MKERRKVTRVAVLFSRLSGYMAACLKALKQEHGVELLVFRWKPATSAPFDAHLFDWIDTLYDKKDCSRDKMVAEIAAFDPHAILMAGWMDRDYLHTARQLRKLGVPVVAGSDTQWRGSARQHLANALASWYLHPAIDILWASGERQRTFARKLGYTGENCWEGYYACDWERFAAVYDPQSEKTPTFLFVGRFVEEKGLDSLIDAYRVYRAATNEPWQLMCVGAGPLLSALEGEAGVILPGFVQPEQLPTLMAQASAFVLPSRCEPWGVVIQEAAATGLPVICSDVCGASVHLVREHYNGFVFKSGNALELAHHMLKMSDLAEPIRRSMGAASHTLSRQYTPNRWARQFVEGLSCSRDNSFHRSALSIAHQSRPGTRQ